MIIKYKDFAGAYNRGDLHFWCSSAGDLDTTNSNVCDLPPRIRNLYLNYWGENYNTSTHCVSYLNQPGILFVYLFDTSYIDDVMEEQRLSSDDSMQRAWYAVRDVANLLVDRFPGCTVFAGNRTDSEGHEIAILIPYDMRGQLNELDNEINEVIYPLFRELL